MKTFIVSLIVVAFSAASVCAQTPATATEGAQVLEPLVVTAKKTDPNVLAPPATLDHTKIEGVTVEDGLVRYSVVIGDIGSRDRVYASWSVDAVGIPRRMSLISGWSFSVEFVREDLFAWKALKESTTHKISADDWEIFFRKAVPFDTRIKSPAGKEIVIEKRDGKPVQFEFIGSDDRPRIVVLRETNTHNVRIHNRDEFGVLPTARGPFHLGKLEGRLCAVQYIGDAGNTVPAIEVAVASQ
jgi:hypothetical protein